MSIQVSIYDCGCVVCVNYDKPTDTFTGIQTDGCGAVTTPCATHASITDPEALYVALNPPVGS